LKGIAFCDIDDGSFTLKVEGSTSCLKPIMRRTIERRDGRRPHKAGNVYRHCAGRPLNRTRELCADRVGEHRMAVKLVPFQQGKSSAHYATLATSVDGSGLNNGGHCPGES